MSVTTGAPIRDAVHRKEGGRGTRRRRVGVAGSRRHLMFVAPAAIFLVVFAVYPLIQLVRMSLSDVRVNNLAGPWEFVGLANVIENFGDGAFGGVVINTIVFVGIVTLLGLVGGLVAAILLAPVGKWPGLILALLVFVWALPPVVNGSVWKFLLGTQGLFNTVLTDLGLVSSAVPFLFDDRIALVSVALVNSWVVIPFNALVYRAAMIGIPAELFEAAETAARAAWSAASTDSTTSRSIASIPSWSNRPLCSAPSTSRLIGPRWCQAARLSVRSTPTSSSSRWPTCPRHR